MIFDLLASLQGYQLTLFMMMLVVFVITLFGSLMLSLLDERVWNVDRTRLVQSRYAMLTAFLGFSVISCNSFLPESWHIPVRVLANCLFVSFVYLVMECNFSDDRAVLKKARQVFVIVIVLQGLLQLTVWNAPEHMLERAMMVHGSILALTAISVSTGLMRRKQMNRIDKSYVSIQVVFLILFVAHTVNFLSTEAVEMLSVSALMLITILLVGHLFTSVSSITYQSLRKVEELSETDWLTGMKNRRYFFENVEKIMSLAQRNSSSCALALFDLDNFKQLNDTYGHCVGDKALVRFAETLRKAIRKHNLQVRWGGEEFLVFFPMASSSEAQHAVDRVLELTRNIEIEVNGELIQITASAGVATLSRFEHLSQAIAHADSALYKAKDLGKDQVHTVETCYS
ncbi:GGDEF domain-containing protein [Reinekea marinisedimentorum]|uniref:diguanylate cyclase n=1 Tax=Reinekea marinisedimentorum TaxID=230495 RepID=A0A4R3I209_9GAMM|nr:GGDEF domain-containing protein [Reinekea marinisedimentorum]TCS38771.1 diguanylate cyclase (GGDEF)-like protein [Reinekea marinisedimentorum]